MEEKIVLKIPDNKTLHILYMCIIEHWAMPSYEVELTKSEFGMLTLLRSRLEPLNRKIQSLDDKTNQDFPVTLAELLVFIQSFRIGFTELGTDFSTVVGGFSDQDAENALGFLKSYLPAEVLRNTGAK